MNEPRNLLPLLAASRYRHMTARVHAPYHGPMPLFKARDTRGDSRQALAQVNATASSEEAVDARELAAPDRRAARLRDRLGHHRVDFAIFGDQRTDVVHVAGIDHVACHVVDRLVRPPLPLNTPAFAH